jgi:predicted HAD superfamily phosphohydrolase YqeG
MITKVKYTDLDNTQVKITLNDGREMFTGVEGATWLHTELNEWLKDNTPLSFMTEDELAQKAIDDARAAFKQERAQAVAAIVVEVDGLLFDGDETSQTRMARAAVAMTDEETIQWVLADNTVTQCTKAELIEALRLAGAAQTAVWVMP